MTEAVIPPDLAQETNVTWLTHLNHIQCTLLYMHLLPRPVFSSSLWWTFMISKKSFTLFTLHLWICTPNTSVSDFNFEDISNVCFCRLRHQAGWFPFRPEQQNHRGGEQGGAAQDEAERHQDLQEIVSDTPVSQLAVSLASGGSRGPQTWKLPCDMRSLCPRSLPARLSSLLILWGRQINPVCSTRSDLQAANNVIYNDQMICVRRHHNHLLLWHWLPWW